MRDERWADAVVLALGAGAAVFGLWIARTAAAFQPPIAAMRIAGWIIFAGAVCFVIMMAASAVTAARDRERHARQAARYVVAAPTAQDVAKFTQLLDRAIAAVRVEAGSEAGTIWSEADSDLSAVRRHAAEALRAWPALGLSRGLSEKGFDQDPAGGRVAEIIDPIESFHQRWRRRHEPEHTAERRPIGRR